MASKTTLAKEKTGYGEDGTESSQQYDNSLVKKYLEENYLPTLKTSLQSKGGNVSNLKVRLLKVDEYLKISDSRFSYDYMSSFTNFNLDVDPCDVSNWLTLTSTFWTMNNVREFDSTSKWYGAYAILVTESTICSNGHSMALWSDYSAKGGAVGFTGSYFGIRPVIETDSSNIKK